MVAVLVVALAASLSAGSTIGALGLVLLAASIVALPWARDAAVLRQSTAALFADAWGGRLYARRTPLGDTIMRNLEEGRRRVLQTQRELEGRALDAERVIDSLPQPLLILDRRRRILHGNLEAENLFGPNLAGRSLAAVIRNPDVLEAVEESGLSRVPTVIEFDLIGPVERQMEARIAPLPRNGTGGEALLLTLQDLTAIRRAEQMRVDFVANVSHELRTPLTSVSGFIETLQTVARDDPEGRDRFLAIMSRETQRMNRLVDDLLSLSRIEMEEHNPPSSAVDLAPVVRSVAHLLEPVAEEFEASVTLETPDDLPPVIGDADQLGQVVRNLVENAIKYGRRGGHVTISAAAEGDQVMLAVRDDGEGIPRELQHRLTERFYRVEKARSRRIGGTGLGLAIVKHIVNRHRGRLQIESEVGKGSVFKVFLPTQR